MKSDETLFVVATIVGCFGIKGYLKVQPNADSPDRFTGLRNVFVGRSIQTAVAVSVQDAIERQHQLLIKFQDIDTRSAAEPLIGQLIFVAEKDVRSPAHGKYFVHDIVGCDVWTKSGRFLGRVEDIYKLPAQDVWVVRIDEREVLIPVVKEFIESVDVAGRKIIINPIEGLIDG